MGQTFAHHEGVETNILLSSFPSYYIGYGGIRDIKISPSDPRLCYSFRTDNEDITIGGSCDWILSDY